MGRNILGFFLCFGVFFGRAFCLDSLCVFPHFQSHRLKDFPLGWLELGILFEQNAVRFVLWEYGRHPMLVVEFDFKRLPAAVLDSA